MAAADWVRFDMPDVHEIRRVEGQKWVRLVFFRSRANRVRFDKADLLEGKGVSTRKWLRSVK